MVIIPRGSTLRLFLSNMKQSWLNAKFRSLWRKNNPHNKTIAKTRFPIEKVTVGRETYGELIVYPFGGTREGLQIGSYCSIAGNVVFILGGVHRMDTVSTYPFARHIYAMEDNPDEATKGKIIIDDDVWIGHGVIITSGVHIGQGAVIGAGSVVTKDVPPYAVYLGTQVKRYRFSDEIIKKLIQIDYSNLSSKQLDRFRDYCKQTVSVDNVDAIVESLTI